LRHRPRFEKYEEAYDVECGVRHGYVPMVPGSAVANVVSLVCLSCPASGLGCKGRDYFGCLHRAKDARILECKLGVDFPGLILKAKFSFTKYA
jgi:hypothetical protein